MENKKKLDQKKLSWGILAGVVIGTAYGAITDDIAQCTGMGASFGLFIGAYWSHATASD